MFKLLHFWILAGKEFHTVLSRRSWQCNSSAAKLDELRQSSVSAMGLKFLKTTHKLTAMSFATKFFDWQVNVHTHAVCC